jgi:hypothetical protein
MQGHGYRQAPHFAHHETVHPSHDPAGRLTASMSPFGRIIAALIIMSDNVPFVQSSYASPDNALKEDSLATPPLNSSMLCRWKLGDFMPSLEYGQMLCRLYQASAAQLGFPASTALMPFSAWPGEYRRVQETIATSWLSALVGNLAFHMSDYAAAQIHFGTAARLGTVTGDAHLICWSLGAQSMAAYTLRRYAKALDLAQQALEYADTPLRRAQILAWCELRSRAAWAPSIVRM